jgi:hypothetical protein
MRRASEGLPIYSGTESSNPALGSLGASKNARDPAIISEGTKGVLSRVLSQRKDKGQTDGVMLGRETGAIRGSRFIRTVAQQRPADGSPAAKEIVEIICLARRERTFTPGVWRAMDQGAGSGYRDNSQPA